MRNALWGLVALIGMLFGCARAGERVSQAPEPPRIAPLARYDLCSVDASLCDGLATRRGPQVQYRGAGSGGPELLLTGPLAGAPAIARPKAALVEQVMKQALPPTAPIPEAPNPVKTAPASAKREALDIEANLTLEVADLVEAKARVRALTDAAGGAVINEVVQDNATQVGAALSIRVPSESAQRFLDDVRGLGKVRSFQIQATDVSRKIADAEIARTNLESALTRYRALLERAANVTELTALEREILRLENALDQLKADLEWTRDRVARATVYVKLELPREERVEHEAKLYPGLRVPYVLDLEPGGSSSGYFGAGLSILIVRALNFDLDLLTHTDGDRSDGVDLLTTTVGTELYSNLLGAGRRPFLNPYFGFRAGYASLSGDSALLLGGGLGLELVKTRAVLLDVQARVFAVLGAKGGTHVFIQPALALNAAY